MAEHHGKPSGANKSESGTGIPTRISPDTEQQEQKISDEYTKDENSIKENIHVAHPNRNTSKDEDREIDRVK